MKKLLFIVCCLFAVVSCNPSPEAQLIMDEEQTILGNKMDLNMSIKSLECHGTVTSQDSCDIYKEKYEKFCTELETTPDLCISYINGCMDTLRSNLAKINHTIKRQSDFNDKYGYRFNVYETKNLKRKVEDLLELFDKLLTRAKRYEIAINTYDVPDKLLGRKFKCTYTIENPLFHKKQECTKKYYISSDMKLSLLE